MDRFNKRNTELVKYNRNTGYYILAISILIIIVVIIYNNKIIFKPKRSMSLLDVGETIRFDETTEITKSISSLPGISNNLFDIGKGYKLEISFNIKIPNTSGSENFHSNYKIDKPIIRFGNSPTIYFNHYDNKMKIFIAYNNFKGVRNNYVFEYRLHLQKWNHILFSINGKNVNFVINGVNVKNQLLNFWPIITTNLNDNVVIGEKYNNIVGEIKDIFININK